MKTIGLNDISFNNPFLVKGDAFVLLKSIPDGSIDLILTSPPYYGQRSIVDGPFKNAASPSDYLRLLKRLGKEFKRILKPTGSLWLNIGDTYREQSLLLVPSRVAIVFEDELGFILRNDVIWEKRSFLMPSIKNRTAHSYEHFFHFVLGPGYYTNKMVSAKPVEIAEGSGRVKSRYGITGEDYRKKIEASLYLSENEKNEASSALDFELLKIKNGEISDFRVLLRGGTSILHAQRKNEIEQRGFAFIESSPEQRLGDVWNVGVSQEKEHDSPFPEELLTYPILSSCPKQGIILDPFVGSGTTLVAAKKLRRKAIGFEIDDRYYELALRRIRESD